MEIDYLLFICFYDDFFTTLLKKIFLETYTTLLCNYMYNGIWNNRGQKIEIKIKK